MGENVRSTDSENNPDKLVERVQQRAKEIGVDWAGELKTGTYAKEVEDHFEKTMARDRKLEKEELEEAKKKVKK